MTTNGEAPAGGGAAFWAALGVRIERGPESEAELDEVDGAGEADGVHEAEAVATASAGETVSAEVAADVDASADVGVEIPAQADPAADNDGGEPIVIPAQARL